MVVVTARIVARPDKRAETAEVVAALTGPSRADAGCRSYRWYVDLEDPNAFSTIETWESGEHVDAHMAAPHTQAALSRLPELVAEPPQIIRYEVSSAQRV